MLRAVTSRGSCSPTISLANTLLDSCHLPPSSSLLRPLQHCAVCQIVCSLSLQCRHCDAIIFESAHGSIPQSRQARLKGAGSAGSAGSVGDQAIAGTLPCVVYLPRFVVLSWDLRGA